MLILLRYLLCILCMVHGAYACLDSDNSCNKKSYISDACCGKMDGINYCDSSVGRLVCKNGYMSSCYCTRHAVMDFQLFAGCCLWHGGILVVKDPGFVICNDGSVSEQCTSQNMSTPNGVL